MSHIHVIGAGLAGLSAAVRLTQQGRAVVVHEATAFAGGRCRSYHDASVGMTIDNGNHLLLSGNRAALGYLRSIGAEERLPEFIEEAMRSGQIADGMMDILSLMPKATIHYATNRFGHCGFREDCELLTTIIRNLGDDATQRLLETLKTAPPAEAAEAIGLVSQLSPENVEKILPARLSQWPRSAHDRAIRQLSSASVAQRASTSRAWRSALGSQPWSPRPIRRTSTCSGTSFPPSMTSGMRRSPRHDSSDRPASTRRQRAVCQASPRSLPARRCARSPIPS